MLVGEIRFVQKNVANSPFIEALRKRVEDFARSTFPRYKLTVPDDLRWWYWLEFGTAGKQDSSAPFPAGSSGTYPIDPVHAKSLAFPGPDGSIRFAMHIDHPGIRPRLIYRGIRDEVLAYAQEHIGNSFKHGGINVAALDAALSQEVMPYAKIMMGNRLDEQAPGTRVDGSLQGASAGAVWNAEAEVTKATE